MKTTADLPNYRSVECCATCLYCADMGIDEEALECSYYSRQMQDWISVMDSSKCDFYKHDGVERP